MPTIDVPSPLATYIVYGVFACLCFGQFAIGFFVPQRYRRNRPLTLLEQRRIRASAAEVDDQPTPGRQVSNSSTLGV